MCGIIAYFGENANGLARILGAMAAILYRAPDSTGAAWFGDEREPLRVRKTVGALSQLVERHLSGGIHPGEAEILIPLWTGAKVITDPRELQNRLLRWEGLPEGFEGPPEGTDFRDLIAAGRSPSVQIIPGTCGTPPPRQSYRIGSAEDLSLLLIDGIQKFDLPPVVVRTLVRKALTDTLAAAGHGSYQGIDEQTATRLLDELFRRCLRTLNLVVPTAEPELAEAKSPEVDEELQVQFGALLRDSPVAIPAEFSSDAVGWLFRLLDGALLSRISVQADLRESAQRELEDSWAQGATGPALDWGTVYLAEKGLNVFGRAAAAAWSCLQCQDIPEQEGAGSKPGWSQQREGVDPTALRYFCTPIIAHGRWALQSPVSEENAHPFLDSEGRRAIVLNGQFSPAVEERLRRFLQQAGFRFRSQNSAEYLAILWGHYFDLLRFERRRGEAIQAQVDDGVDAFNLGSQAIDYRVLSMIKGKSDPELDALAFREAAAKISADGGQIAAAGISLLSPRSLFVVSHNRPVFLVRREDSQEIMVVSDVNAALGLFSQTTIQEKTQELRMLRNKHAQAEAELRAAGVGMEVIRDRGRELKETTARLLEAFRVMVLPLEGEQKFACVETRLQGDTLRRGITVSNLEGIPITDLEEIETVLDPLQVEEQVFASFFETHLEEIPGRLQDILNAYLPEAAQAPRFSLRRRLLIRRFDQGLVGLQRVVLVGMGSSYHAGLMARSMWSELLPEVEVLVLRPVEVEHALRLMEPEKDLVVLLSWSGTTADMVEFARELEASTISFVVVTNKPYSELGLFARRSLGVVNLISGEEVTFSSVKSTYSVMFGSQLLAAWLAVLRGRSKEAEEWLNTLSSLPASLQQLLDDAQVVDTASRWARQESDCSKGFVFDDLLYGNGGIEAAWKLEENGRRIVCRALDYRNTLPRSLCDEPTGYLVLVNATSQARLGEALELMKRLFLAGVRFYAVSYAHPKLEQLRFYSQDQLLIVPKLEDACQCYIDLVVFYRFVQCVTKEAGKGIPGFPRNRAKSVTTTRSRQKRFPDAGAELALMRGDLEQLSAVPLPDFCRTTLWEKKAHTVWEKRIYRHIRKSAERLSREEPLGAVFRRCADGPERLSAALFDELGEGGEVLFLCCDRTSWAAGYEAAAVWGRMLQAPLRVFYRLEELPRRDEQLPVVVLASAVPDRNTLEQLHDSPQLSVCWVGPALGQRHARRFEQSLGYYVLADDFPPCAYAQLYGGVLLLLAAACRQASSLKGRVLRSLIASAGKAVLAVFEDERPKDSIDAFWRQNHDWDTAFYISPPSGIGYVWEQLFDATGGLSIEHHVYGDSAHGPIATVDPRVAEKFIRLEPRDRLVEAYGTQRVAEWESSFGSAAMEPQARWSADRTGGLRSGGLVHAEGGWYLPVLAPRYDILQDNLIILDATRPRYFEQARDEAEVFSCRYARMLLVSQRGFYRSSVQGKLFGGTTGEEPVLLPALGPGGAPIPDALVPFASHLVAVAFAAACLGAKGRANRTPVFTPREETRVLLGGKLPLLGTALLDSQVNLAELDHLHLATLERLAPLVSSVEEAHRFEVRRFSSQERLDSFLNKADVREKEDVIEHFRIVRAQGLPFYLMKASYPPERAATCEGGPFETWEQVWREAFGMSWEALSSGMVQIGESSKGAPVIEVPLLSAPRSEGSLLRFYVRYLEWNHAQSLEAQLADTLEAMQRGLMSLRIQSPGYLTMVNRFNQLMQPCGQSWNDWLIALVPRSWLLYKPSEELAAVVAQRVEQLLAMAPGGEGRLERARTALDSVWESLGETESDEEPSRRRSLFEKLERELGGGSG